MKFRVAPVVTALALLVAVSPLAGCESYQEVELQEPDGIKPGPGLFSGEDGVFTIYSKGGAREGEGSGVKDK